MKVYVVTEGEYSDYGIEAVCSTREKAEQVCKAITEADKYKDPKVEEWKLDEIPSRIDKGLSVYGVRWVGDLQDLSVWKAELTTQASPLEKIDSIIESKPIFVCYIETKDEDHARKIALEKFIQWKAEGGK